MRRQHFFKMTAARVVSFYGFVCLALIVGAAAAGQKALVAQEKSDAGAGQPDSQKPSGATGLRDSETMKKRLGEITSKGTETGSAETADRKGNKQTESIIPDHPGEAMQDPGTREKYLAALRGYYDYRLSGYTHRQRVFAWQLLSARLIFAVVLLLVFTGIYFAAIQFRRGMKEGEKTEITASLKGITVSSPVLGVIILTISFAFFYLYLVYVYPIAEVF